MRSDQWEISFNTLVETTQWMIWEYRWFLHARTHFACRKYPCPEFSCLTSLRLLAAVLSPRIPLIRCEDSVGNGLMGGRGGDGGRKPETRGLPLLGLVQPWPPDPSRHD